MLQPASMSQKRSKDSGSARFFYDFPQQYTLPAPPLTPRTPVNAHNPYDGLFTTRALQQMWNDLNHNTTGESSFTSSCSSQDISSSSQDCLDQKCCYSEENAGARGPLALQQQQQTACCCCRPVPAQPSVAVVAPCAPARPVLQSHCSYPFAGHDIGQQHHERLCRHSSHPPALPTTNYYPAHMIDQNLQLTADQRQYVVVGGRPSLIRRRSSRKRVSGRQRRKYSDEMMAVGVGPPSSANRSLSTCGPRHAGPTAFVVSGDQIVPPPPASIEQQQQQQQRLLHCSRHEYPTPVMAAAVGPMTPAADMVPPFRGPQPQPFVGTSRSQRRQLSPTSTSSEPDLISIVPQPATPRVVGRAAAAAAAVAASHSMGPTQPSLQLTSTPRRLAVEPLPVEGRSSRRPRPRSADARDRARLLLQKPFRAEPEEVFVEPSATVEPERDVVVMDRKRIMRLGTQIFNRKPSEGIEFLLQQRFLTGPKSAAAFLLNRKNLSRSRIGEYFSDCRNQFASQVLLEFTEAFEFRDKPIDEALRYFQQHFRLAGESGQISYLLEAFARRYLACNPTFSATFCPGDGDNIGGSTQLQFDRIFMLAYAVMILFTDLHRHSKGHKRMKISEFIANTKGASELSNANDEVLKAIYNRVKRSELACLPDHTTLVQKLQERLLPCQCPVGRGPVVRYSSQPSTSAGAADGAATFSLGRPASVGSLSSTSSSVTAGNDQRESKAGSSTAASSSRSSLTSLRASSTCQCPQVNNLALPHRRLICWCMAEEMRFNFNIDWVLTLNQTTGAIPANTANFEHFSTGSVRRFGADDDDDEAASQLLSDAGVNRLDGSSIQAFFSAADFTYPEQHDSPVVQIPTSRSTDRRLNDPLLARLHGHTDAAVLRFPRDMVASVPSSSGSAAPSSSATSSRLVFLFNDQLLVARKVSKSELKNRQSKGGSRKKHKTVAWSTAPNLSTQSTTTSTSTADPLLPSTSFCLGEDDSNLFSVTAVYPLHNCAVYLFEVAGTPDSTAAETSLPYGVLLSFSDRNSTLDRDSVVSPPLEANVLSPSPLPDSVNDDCSSVGTNTDTLTGAEVHSEALFTGGSSSSCGVDSKKSAGSRASGSGSGCDDAATLRRSSSYCALSMRSAEDRANFLHDLFECVCDASLWAAHERRRSIRKVTRRIESEPNTSGGGATAISEGLSTTGSDEQVSPNSSNGSTQGSDGDPDGVSKRCSLSSVDSGLA